METKGTNANLHVEETLDPEDWSDALTLSHRLVDEAVGYLQDVRDRPVWQNVPEDVRAFFATPVPHTSALSRHPSSDRAERDALSNGQRSPALPP